MGFQKKHFTINELMGGEENFLKHLRSSLKKGMNFDNYGQWVIHHKKQCYTFNLSDPKEQLKCFGWHNIIPMWRKDHEKLHKNEGLTKLQKIEKKQKIQQIMNNNEINRKIKNGTLKFYNIDTPENKNLNKELKQWTE